MRDVSAIATDGSIISPRSWPSASHFFIVDSVRSLLKDGLSCLSPIEHLDIWAFLLITV